MRAREFIVEDRTGPMSTNLVSVLDTIRNSFADRGQDPRVRVDALINMVREIPGSEMFNVDMLKDLYDRDTTVKNLISNIKKDDTGTRYIYLSPAIGQVGDIETEPEQTDMPTGSGDIEAGAGPENTVRQMSKRALGRRK